MSVSRLEYLFDAYVHFKCTKEEEVELMSMLVLPENELAVQQCIDGIIRDTGAETKMPEQAAATVLQNILRKGEYSKVRTVKSKMSFVMWVRAAAAILILVTGTYLFTSRKSEVKTTAKTGVKKTDPVLPGGNRALLTMADGTTILLDSMENGTLQQGGARINKQGGMLTFHSQASMSDNEGKVLYNTLSTPSGGQYQVILPDGSKVWLNAESSLKFPVAFSGDSRLVFLKGEGYFEVAKKPSMPFQVSADGAMIEVLGTHFNINAYTDENSIATTVLEGSVKVSRQGVENNIDYALLKAGEQAGLDKSGEFKIDTQSDLEQVVAWKNEMFQFNNADLLSMMRQFSRWYSVKIEFKGTVPARKFSGKFSRNMTLDQLVEMLRYAGINMKTDKNNIVVFEEIPVP